MTLLSMAGSTLTLSKTTILSGGSYSTVLTPESGATH